MKKSKRIRGIALVLFVLSTMPLFAIEKEIPIAIGGAEIKFESAKPFIDLNGRTQTPARHIGESLGAKVDWNGAESKAIFKRDGIVLEFIIGEKDYYINGKTHTMDTEAIVIDGSTYVPVRYIAEGLGATVQWDNVKQMVNIESNSVVATEQRKEPFVKLYLSNRAFVMKNRTIDLTDFKSSIGNIDGNTLMIPLEHFADAAGGSFEQDEVGKTCTAIIDGVKFEFQYHTDVVMVDGKSKKMAYETTVKDHDVSVPVSLFSDTLPSYDLTIYRNIAFKLELKENLREKVTLEEVKRLEEKAHSWVKDAEIKYSKEVENIADHIISKIIKPGMKDVEKITAINEYIIKNTEYSLDFRGDYDALLHKKAVCQGYSGSTRILLDKVGIENYEVFGYTGTFPDYDTCDLLEYAYRDSAHSWNLVKVEGAFYHLDTTWNDPLNPDENRDRSLNYTLLSDEEMLLDHVWLREAYPSADISYYDDVADKSNSIEIEINSLDGKVDENINLVIQGAGGNLAMRRTTVFEKGQEHTQITLPLGSVSADAISFLDVNQLESEDHKTNKVYEIDTKQNGRKYTVNIKSIDFENVDVVVAFETPAIKQEVMGLYIVAATTDNRAVEIIGRESCLEDVNIGDTQVTFSIRNGFPTELSSYTLTIVTKEGMLFFDTEGKIYEASHYFEARKSDLSNIKVTLPSLLIGKDNKPVVTEGAYTDKTFLTIKDALIKAHYGDHKTLKDMKEISDCKSIEKEAPSFVDERGTLTYSEEITGDTYLFRTYGKASSEDKINYHMTLNNFDITADNYKAFYTDMVTLLKSEIGTESNFVSSYMDYTDYSRVVVDINDLDDNFYEDLSKKRKSFGGKFKVDNVTYELEMVGNVRKNTIAITVRTSIEGQ